MTLVFGAIAMTLGAVIINTIIIKNAVDDDQD
jgi:hypothetical protein